MRAPFPSGCNWMLSLGCSNKGPIRATLQLVSICSPQCRIDVEGGDSESHPVFGSIPLLSSLYLKPFRWALEVPAPTDCLLKWKAIRAGDVVICRCCVAVHFTLQLSGSPSELSGPRFPLAGILDMNWTLLGKSMGGRVWGFSNSP